MGLARQLAERIATVQHGDIPPAAETWSKVALADTLACTLAGCGDDAPRIALDALELEGVAGPCLVLGSNRHIGALDAAYVNGVAAHVLDYDNTAANMGGHVSAVLWPALWAAGQAHGASGRDLLLAHTVGVEAGARIGETVNPLHSDKGWHPTATVGVFAATAACARLLKLDVAQCETALALATSLASGIKANFGTMAKSMHCGLTARSGLMAALLAKKGFTANPEAFEHKQGFFNLFNGAGNFNATAGMPHWGNPWEIIEPGAAYKMYPCCYSTHSAVEAALNLVREHGRFAAADIQAIETYTSDKGLLHTDRPNPQSALDAKFSVQYCVTRAALNGEVSLSHFEGESFRDATVQGVLRRVKSAPIPEGMFPQPARFAAEVRITLANGKTLTSRVQRPLGRTSANPVPPERMRGKFDDCCRRVLTADAVAQAWRVIDAFETEPDITRLMQCLTPAAKPAASAA